MREGKEIGGGAGSLRSPGASRHQSGGRQSGKTAAMLRELARAKPGLVAVIGPHGTRYIDVQGEAQVVDEPPALLSAPEPEGRRDQK